MKNTIFFVNLIMCLWENLWTSVTLILLTAALGPMTVTAAELLTTSRMNLGAEEFLTLVNVLYCTRVKECKCFHPWSSNESLHYYVIFFDWKYKFSGRNILYCLCLQVCLTQRKKLWWCKFSQGALCSHWWFRGSYILMSKWSAWNSWNFFDVVNGLITAYDRTLFLFL